MDAESGYILANGMSNVSEKTLQIIFTLTDILLKTWKLHRVTQLWNFSYSQLKHYSRTLNRYVKVILYQLRYYGDDIVCTGWCCGVC